MSSLAFDTHKFVTDLTKAGMDTGMAEGWPIIMPP